jgi:hypothetical protein
MKVFSYEPLELKTYRAGFLCHHPYVEFVPMPKLHIYHSLNTVAAKVKIEFTLEQVKNAQRVVEV